MCGCQDAFREQYFGRQIHPYGELDRIEKTGSELGKAVFLPTNPLQFTPELDFTGYRYADAQVYPVDPLYFQKGYNGVLPIAEQPKIDLPQPYREPVVF